MTHGPVDIEVGNFLSDYSASRFIPGVSMFRTGRFVYRAHGLWGVDWVMRQNG